jgi:uncharacterized protein
MTMTTAFRFPWPHAGALLVVTILVALPSRLPPAEASSVLLLGGLLSGLLAGMLGIGGALISVPALYLALPRLGVSADQLPHAVVASALVAMVPTTLMAGWSHWRGGSLSTAWLLRMAPAMVVGAMLGALVATQLRGVVLAVAFAAQAIWYGVRMMRQGPEEAATAAVPGGLARLPVWLAGAAAAAFGACVGMGVGSMTTPVLRSRGVALRTAVATAGTLNLCVAVGGAAAFWASAIAGGTVPPIAWPAALLLGGTAILAAPIGVALAQRLRTAQFRFGVGAINIVGALALMASAASASPAGVPVRSDALAGRPGVANRVVMLAPACVGPTCGLTAAHRRPASADVVCASGPPAQGDWRGPP